MVENNYPVLTQPLLVKDRLTTASTRPPLLLCGNGNIDLGKRTSNSLATLICERNEVDPLLKDKLLADLYAEPAATFPDGETKISKIGPECTGRQVFIFQTVFPDQDRKLMEVFLMADAARRAGAKEIIAVLPYFAYGRKDRKDEPRVPISASAVVNLLNTSGVDRIITLDVHTDQIQGMTTRPWDNLYISKLMVPKIRELIDPDNSVVLCTDVGGIIRGKAYKKRVPSQGLAFLVKEREVDETTSQPNSLLFIGDVKEKDVLIVDDESVSLSSIANAAKAAVENGAKKVVAVVSHLKDSESNRDFPKMLKLLNSLPTEFAALLTTDNIIHQPQILNHPLVKIVDTSDFWAEIIWRTAFGVPLAPDLID